MRDNLHLKYQICSRSCVVLTQSIPNIDERIPSEESKLYGIALPSAYMPLIARHSRVSEQILLEPLKRSCHSILQCEFWPPQWRLTVNVKGYGSYNMVSSIPFVLKIFSSTVLRSNNSPSNTRFTASNNT